MRFSKEGQELNLEEFERLVGVKWISHLDFEEESILKDIQKEGLKFYKKGEMTYEQLWFGKYYKKELQNLIHPLLEVRWIDPALGWGVFALQDIKKMQFVCEYVGKVRRRKKPDPKNAYSFEYIAASGCRSSFVIDAREAGNVSRYINHSDRPNLQSALATLDYVSHVILYAKEPIAKGTQLCYDYGPDYWTKRATPIQL